MEIEFRGTTAPTGLEIADPKEQRRLHVRTDTPVSPRPIDAEGFCFPVDTACAIETESMVFDQRYYVSIHDEAGRSKDDLEANGRYDLDGQTRFVSLSGPIKLYCRVEATGTIEVGLNSIHFTFDEEATVVVGGRSLHEQPVGTIRTPADCESMMTAVSMLSSALKTDSPERTWPTLRGHPPLIEQYDGDSLEIPDDIEPFESSIRLEIPPNYRDLYAISPLAFYLGAEIRSRPSDKSSGGGGTGAGAHSSASPNTTATLVTELAEYELGVGCHLEDDVAKTLKHLFLLDCIVRMEGIYGYEIHERNVLESRLPFDLKTVYEASLSERLERYLDVPYELTEPHVPRWPLTAYVPSTADGVETLPFVLDQLGIVREPRGEQRARTAATTASSRFVRSTETETNRRPVFTPGEDESEEPTWIVEPAVRDSSIEHAWFGDHAPSGASKALLESYHNQLARGPRNDAIEILLVCNDVRMLEEHDVLDTTYGNRETLPFDVHSEFGVTTDKLATLLADGGYDFLHYIGHATPAGLECLDGKLDVSTLPSVEIGVFFLNACQSYEQGLELVKKGAFGGIATLDDVVNEHATNAGETIARLLNAGFPLRSTLEIVRESTEIGNQYLIIGDGSTDVAQCDGGAPGIDILKKGTNGTVDYSIQVYSTKAFKIGTLTSPNIDESGRYLTPKRCHQVSVEEAALQNYLTWGEGPALLDGELYWNSGIGLNDLL